jgi:hypothetical protein
MRRNGKKPKDKAKNFKGAQNVLKKSKKHPIPGFSGEDPLSKI